MTGPFEPGEAAGLARMQAFQPRMGRAYAAGRNRDEGPPTRADAPLRRDVSALSPWLRHRLITEQAAIAAAAPHGEHAAKFVSEVLWRGYFKGWLEHRPQVWSNYCAGRDAALAAVQGNAGLSRAYAEAVEGRTGIDCFDAWARELVEWNWLHNHARMWFASIWIFTLRLPWELGADFFLRHLMDGDPASNTLSWRWVGGLHTRGKHYLARRENIVRYTDGRFDPAGLNETAEPLPLDDEPARRPLPPSDPWPGGDFALLLHPEDCAFSTLDLPRAPVRIIGVTPPDRRAASVAPAVTAFSARAVADAAARAGEHFGCPVDLVSDWPDAEALPLVAPWMPTGWWRDTVPAHSSIAWRRQPYDDAIWPLATAGFFKVKAGAGRALGRLGLDLPPL
ncbi:FAD-binding domain-containing protein [Sphingomonas sp. FW199]|uniref:FAD-binding domain-containing protein n=1 Tax=Sphingomonas sp. FW199 TaxID=3400217 RepID=UPI003CEF8ED6